MSSLTAPTPSLSSGWRGAFVVILTLSCNGAGGDGRVPTSASLPPGIVARVADDTIHAATVGSVARAQGVSTASARDRIIADALFAVAQRERPNGEWLSRHAERAALARVLLESLEEQARQMGPPTQAEVSAILRAQWWNLDRPELRRAVHAVVRVREPKEASKAEALAEKIRAAVAGVTDPDEFAKKARAVDPGGLEVVVERVDPVAPDGRTVDPEEPPPPGTGPGNYVQAFANAVHAIADVGKQSPVVKTEFGYHVILLVARYPERRLSFDEGRQLLGDQIMSERAGRLKKELVGELRRASHPAVERSALELTKSIRVAP